MILHDAPQGSPEWRAARAGLATASRFADVLATIKSGEAAARRNYRAQLVVERLTGRPVDGFQTQAMRTGTEREPVARAAYESRTGIWVEEVGFMRHDTLECGASLDGLVSPDGSIECKCPELPTHLTYLRLSPATAPAEYVAQIQGEMWIADRAWCDFVSWHPDFPDGLQLVVRRVMRDDTYIASLALAVSLFMDEVKEEESAVRNLAPVDQYEAALRMPIAA